MHDYLSRFRSTTSRHLTGNLLGLLQSGSTYLLCQRLRNHRQVLRRVELGN
jgi:hypothetical protein